MTRRPLVILRLRDAYGSSRVLDPVGFLQTIGLDLNHDIPSFLDKDVDAAMTSDPTMAVKSNGVT
jgi:hypothetical protein